VVLYTQDGVAAKFQLYEKVQRGSSPRVPTLPRGIVAAVVRNAYECMGTRRSLVSAGDSASEADTDSLRGVGSVATGSVSWIVLRSVLFLYFIFVLPAMA